MHGYFGLLIETINIIHTNYHVQYETNHKIL